MLQSIIQVKLVAMAAALGLNTADWQKPSSAMVEQVKALEGAMALIRENKAAEVQGKVKEAIDKIQELAKNGDKDAQYAMGLFAQNQQGGFGAALQYYTLAAKQNQLQAMNNLGFLTMSVANQLPEKDRPAKVQEGVEWIKKASDAGNNPAKRNMAQLYMSGQAGVERNVEKAHALLDSAAKSNPVDDQAEYELFQFYSGSAGPDKADDKQAQYWLDKSAKDGNASGLDTLGSLYLQGGKIGKIEVKKDEAEAVKLFKKLADNDNAVGNRKMGGVCEAGIGGQKKDYKEAVAYYEKAAQGNDGVAQFRLASMFDTGWDPDNTKGEKAIVQRNDAAALSLYKLALQNKIAIAGYNVAVFYEQGRAVDKDLTKAFTFYLEAAESNVPLAMQKVGVYYANGAGALKDPIASAGWFQRAGAAGLPDGTLAYASLMEQGAAVVPKDDNPYLEAGKLYNDVLSNPNASDALAADALLRLGGLYYRGVTTLTTTSRTPSPDYKRAYMYFQTASTFVNEKDANGKETVAKLLDAAKTTGKLTADEIKTANGQADSLHTSIVDGRKRREAASTSEGSAPSAPPVASPAPTRRGGH